VRGRAIAADVMEFEITGQAGELRTGGRILLEP
jgi:hypothetical protein